MIFSLILLIRKHSASSPRDPEPPESLHHPRIPCGGAVIYWFTGASTQAVTTGAYRAVEYIKKNIKLDDNASKSASTEKSKEVVKICTQYAQKGMFNIFIAIFSFALAFAFFSAPVERSDERGCSFFISYLISIAVFGLFQAIFMANAGGAGTMPRKWLKWI